MPYFLFVWNDHITAHIEEHGVSMDEFEAIVSNPARVSRSRSSDRTIAFGNSDDGRLLACVYELEGDEMTFIPVTAYFPED